MPTTETAEAVSRSATELARRLGLTAQEFNVALKLAGLLGGEPGAYFLTEQGKRLATQHFHHNGYGGHAARSWDTKTWLETVIDELDLSEAGIARIRQVLAARKLAQKTAREAGRAAAEAAFLRIQAAKRAADAAQDAGGGARTWVIVGLGVTAGTAAAYGLYTVWQRRRDRAGAPEPARERGERRASPEDLK